MYVCICTYDCIYIIIHIYTPPPPRIRKPYLAPRYWPFLILTARKLAQISHFDILVGFLNFYLSLLFWCFFLIFVIPPCCFSFAVFFNVFTQKCVCSILLVFSQNLAPGMSPSDSPQKTIQGAQILVQIGARRVCLMTFSCFPLPAPPPDSGHSLEQ